MVVPNGIYAVLLGYSRIFNINPSFDGSPSQAVLTTGVSIIFNNSIHDFTTATSGIVTQPSHSVLNGNDAYYNNLIWNTGTKTPFILETTGPTANSAVPNFLNNTIVQDTNGYCLAVGTSTTGSLGGLTWENNQCVSNINPANGFICTNTLDPTNCSSYSSGGTSAANILMSHALATTDAYTLSDLFSPTAPTSPTVAAGIPNSIVSTVSDIGARPDRSLSTWSLPILSGVWLWSLPHAGGRHQDDSPSGTVPLTVNFDASGSTTSVGTITDYKWNFGDGPSIVDTLTSPTTSHTYTSGGNFISSVTITTSLGPATATGVIVILSRAAGLALGSAQAPAGSDAALSATFTASPDIGVSGFQFDLILPASVSYDSTTLGPVSIAASKQLSDNPAIPRVLIIGLNQTVISTGAAATVYLHIAADTPTGPITIPLANLVATDPNGNAVLFNGVNGSITVSGSITVTGPVSEFSPRLYPNPWRSDKDSGIPITFDQLVGDTTIKIFTVSGHLVQTLTTSGASIPWDRTNKSGDTVASGFYFYVITNDQGQKTTGKFVIIK